ncbi:MAG: hypothetical protein RLZZ200_2598, partial [Pseudomonadota bacterium]
KQSQFSFNKRDTGYFFNVSDVGGADAQVNQKLQTYLQHLVSTYTAASLDAVLGTGFDLGPNPGVDAEIAKFQAEVEPRLTALTAAANDAAGALADQTAATQALSALSSARDQVWSAYDTEAQKLQTLADAMTGFGKSLRALHDSALLGAESPLNPMERLAEAQRQFQLLAPRAALGDQDALSRFADARQAYLEAARVYASGDQYNAIFAEVQSATAAAASTAERTASNTGAQISLMQSQVEQLIGIRAGVQSLAMAMDAYRAAGAGSGLTGRQADINNAYLATLGRVADPAGMAYWNASGQSQDAILAALMASPEHMSKFPKFADGGVASGWALVGERGPEMAHFGSPTRIYPANQTGSMLSSAANDAKIEALIAEVKALRADAQRQHGESVQANMAVTREAAATVAQSGAEAVWAIKQRPAFG